MDSRNDGTGGRDVNGSKTGSTRIVKSVSVKLFIGKRSFFVVLKDLI